MEQPYSNSPGRLSCAVLDDDLVDLDHLRRLTKGTQIRLATFQFPGQLLKELRVAHFDVLILDGRMGATSGLEVFESIREAGWLGPVILLTGSGDEHLVAEAFRSGFADYLGKADVTASVLERAIGNAVDKSRLESELNEKTQELAERVHQLGKSNAEIRRVCHHLSHELKTPLTSAREFVSIVHDEFSSEMNEVGRDLLTKAMRNCDQLKVHMNDLLDVTRIDTGKTTLKLCRQPVEDVVDLVAAAHASSCKSKNIDLSVDTMEPRLNVIMDDHRVFQIVSNLVSNAVKFTPEGGAITICLGRDIEDPATLTIDVIDTGRGIAAHHLEVIFERLRQTRTEDSEVQGGLGIGLYLCRELAALHDGNVTVESALGVGSTFTVRLPLDGPESPHSTTAVPFSSKPDLNGTLAPATDPLSPITA